jgi:prepilin peptidase CpaA
MFEWTLQHIVFIVGVGLLTGIAVYTDTKLWKIHNKLTVPFFALGWIYQIAFWGLPGLQDGLAGFAVGFGTYLLLFMVAGGGGGDVKLVGALSVWLGLKLTVWMMVASTLIVILDVAAITLYKVLRHGMQKWKRDYLATGKVDAKGKVVVKQETLVQKQKRRILPFAIPVAMATWLLMLLNGAGVIKEGQLGPQRQPVKQQAQVVER